MENFNKLKKLISSLEVDATKFYEKNNKAAGARLRKGMQELKVASQKIRIEVSDINKNK